MDRPTHQCEVELCTKEVAYEVKFVGSNDQYYYYCRDHANQLKSNQFVQEWKELNQNGN